MPILNYTTTVTVAKTVAEIMECLRQHGARDITASYDGQGEAVGLAFMVIGPNGELAFQLPVRLKGAYGALLKAKGRGGIPITFGQYYREGADKERAKRVAWRNLKSWVEVQMAMLEMDMVSMEEIFLPYMLTDNNKTVFDRLRDRGFLQLNAPVEGKE